MSEDLKTFYFLLREHQAWQHGWKNGRAWDRATTAQRMRSQAAYMIGVGVDPSARPYEYA